MRGSIEARAHREWLANNSPEARVARNKCPRIECNGSLDTGWECIECGYDAMPIALQEKQ